MSVAPNAKKTSTRHLSLVAAADDSPPPVDLDTNPVGTRNPGASARDHKPRRVDTGASDGPAGARRGRSGTAGGAGRMQRQSRARQLAEFSDDARQLRNQVLQAALAAGTPINPDAVSAILAAKAQQGGPLRYFTEDLVWDLVWFDISHWCGKRAIDLPGGLHRALWFLLGYLHSAHELHPHSDHVDDLRAPLLSSAGLGPGGEPRFGF